ncbi:nuclear transport factor 2 family protein [Mycobacterium sp. IDR2000157661]|uniref:nuclear transport factor 2 family protein n=1 Tax=Mycobacterium sp. IDR2000157661 TaxID=2867005 RepID=UPI001EEBB184|nr:nuclear transport factor 2 family protein [Mycobacterium sp. IDR2000157661]ULE32351.1 nuclear transport factor 2 family protein [Mycobacterium sp. IDR2000157661]
MVHAFRQAVEAGDLDAVVALLRDDVEFHSPVVFRPYRGRAALRPILAAVMEVFEDFRYIREIGAAEAREHALVFQARVGDKEIEGCDFIRLDEAGAVKELTVMVRPLSATLALAEQMRARLAAM